MRYVWLFLGLVGLVGCPSEDRGFSYGDDDDATAADDDDATGDDDDATAREVEGVIEIGAVDDVEDPVPAPAGIVVAELGTSAVGVTNSAGVFTIEPEGDPQFELLTEYATDTYVPSILVYTWEQWSRQPELVVEVQHREHVDYHYAYEFGGIAYSPAHATVVALFVGGDGEEIPAPVGLKAELNLEHDNSWAIFENGTSVATDTLPEGAEASLDFARVEPGVGELTLTLPPELSSCVGPGPFTVRADTDTVVTYFCE